MSETKQQTSPSAKGCSNTQRPERRNGWHQGREQWLRMLIDSAEDYAIFAVDPDGRICTWNKGAENLFGYSEEEILDKEFSTIFTPEDRAGGVPSREVEHALREGYAPDERWHMRKDGSRFFVSGCVRPLRGEKDRVHGFLKVAHDITDKKRMDEVLNQYRTLFESSPGLYLVLTPDDDYRVVAASDAYLSATMTRREEVIGRRLFEVFPDEPGNPKCSGERNLRASLQRVVQQRQRDVMPLQYYPIPRRGQAGGGFEDRWWSPVNTPVLNDRGEVAHIIHRVEDLTTFVREMQKKGKAPENLELPDRRLRQMAEEIVLRGEELQKAKEDLARSHAQLEAAFQTIQDGIIVADAQGNFVLINEAQAQISGYDSAAELRKNVAEYAGIFELRSPEGQLVRFEDWPWARVLRGETLTNWQLHGKCLLNGHEWDFSFSGQPVRDEKGQVELGVVVTRDITEARRSQLAIQEARDQLAAANQDLEQRVQERTAKLTQKVQELESVSYSLSHDLRAPLRAIGSFAQILQNDFREQLGARGGDLLARIFAAAGRLDELIEDVLTLSRLNRQNIQVKPVNLDKLVRDIVHERPALQRPNAVIEIDAPLDPVIGHESSLSQCFSNLLDNAVKFVEPGVVPQVRVWTEKHDGMVRAFVEDNGIGIDKEHSERIFQMFQRLHPPGVYEGNGIGLTIVRQAVERMGGKVGVESTPGRGSRFCLDLPVAPQLL